jgi:Cdc6-like AAA superfamily ATPase
VHGACLILISNSETALHGADPRVRSRLASAENIEFPTYKESEVAGILRDRAEWGLVPGAIKGAQLERIAAASGGDARVSIDTLRIVAEDAENQDLERIPDSLIERALPKAMRKSAERSFEMLPAQLRLMLELLREGVLDSGELFRRYQAASGGKGLQPVVDRTFRNYAERLIQMGLISSEGSGRWRRYRLSEQASGLGFQ